MATFTWPTRPDLERFLEDRGILNLKEFQGIEAGSVNSNFKVDAGATSFFLRLYEDQDLGGACSESELTVELARRGVPTPAPIGPLGLLAGHPAVLLPWVAGTHCCQRSVSPGRARAVGEALARVHRAGGGLAAPAGRFTPDALRRHLQTIAASPLADQAPPLQAALDRAVAARQATPTGLIHGDLFRDNVLWDGERIAALVDFESASLGSFAFDLAVTLLAWTFGDDFEPPLARAMVEGYASVRAVGTEERVALYNEARLAALRFTITRITDYALRVKGTGVMKDWKRFQARYLALEAMGDGAFRGLVGLVGP